MRFPSLGWMVVQLVGDSCPPAENFSQAARVQRLVTVWKCRHLSRLFHCQTATVHPKIVPGMKNPKHFLASLPRKRNYIPCFSTMVRHMPQTWLYIEGLVLLMVTFRHWQHSSFVSSKNNHQVQTESIDKKRPSKPSVGQFRMH